MNKNLLQLIAVLLLCSLAAPAFVSCSDRNEYDHPSAYLEAIDNNDFEKAHKVLTHLYGKYINAYNKDLYNKKECSRAYWTAAEHVYKAEMQWLLPQNDAEANRRLIYTLDEMNATGSEPIPGHPYDYSDKKSGEAYMEFIDQYNKICLEIVKIAVHNGNLEMARQAIDMIKTGYTMKESGDKYIFTPNNMALERAQALID